MKTLIFVLIAFSICANAGDNVKECQDVGETAKKVMQLRQNNQDFFKVLEEYQDKNTMVFDAYEVPLYDSMSQLGIAIRSRKTKPAEIREFNRIDALRKNAINQFQLKYIKLCLRSK